MSSHPSLIKGSFFGLLLVLVALSACSAPARPTGRFPVGVTTVSFLDKQSHHPLTCEVWYPAPDTTVEENQKYAGAYRGLAARDAPLRRGQRYPLVVVSHGLRGSRYDLSWLAEGLATDGFIVAAVDHPGSDAATYVESEAPKLWVRAHALSSVIDELQRSRFAAAIDSQHIVAMGHSLGGSTVLVLGGAHLDPQRFMHRFPQSSAPPTAAARDRRVRAVIALAPGTAQVFTEAGVQALSVPTLIISGTSDYETPELSNAAFYAGSLAHATPTEWHSVPKAGHYTFAPTCTVYGKIRARKVCNDVWDLDRFEVHQQVIDWTRAFLRRQLAS